MEAGKLDRRITLQRYGITYNQDNEPLEAWEDIATVWASVAYVSDGEKIRAAQVGASVTVRFQIRYSSLVADLSAKDRVRFDGHIFDLSGVKPLGRLQGFELTAASQVNG
jgi:phage head-tail adaptor, putative, SPP1 family